MSPPTALAATSSTRSANSSGPGIESLKVIARSVLWNCGIDFGPHKINRLCVRFVEQVQGNGFAFFDFLANAIQMSAEQRRRALADPDVSRAIAYADPTGETAIRNVMRGGSR